MTEAQNVEIGGVALRCDHCDNDGFIWRRAQLNTALMTLLDMDWLNESAQVYVCVACGRLHWFSESINSASDMSYPIECMACGKTIPAGETECESCGWTYDAPDGESPEGL
jgi:ribosomal protein S27E